ncbi:MAG TPA: ParB/RepB/Spo0J family partition protein [Gaiellales bacterium]
MAETRAKGLGLGLSALLGDSPAGTGERLVEIPLDDLRPNANQPRAHFDESELSELVASIRRDGVLQPVLVRPALSGSGFELIAGERRWRAARIAGLAAIPAVVREADDREALALAVVENVVRSDLDPIEEARAYARLCDEMGLTQADVAQAVGRSRVSVTNALRLLDLPDEVLGLLERRELSEGHGRALLQAPDHDDRRRLAAEAVRRSWSVRALETAARAAAGAQGPSTTRRRSVAPAWFDPAAADDLVDAAYAALGVPARLATERQGIRLELRVRDADELGRLRDALWAAGMLRSRPGD